jgi:hypothetical protein
MPDNSLLQRLSKNYNLPLQVTRGRWTFAKKKASTKDGVDFIKALQIMHDMRAEPLPKSSSTLPLERRKQRFRESTQFTVPRRDKK